MKSVLHALVLFAVMAVLAWLLATLSNNPIPVTLTLGTLALQTSLGVAAILLLVVLLLAFYVGRFTAWLFALPRALHNLRTRKAPHQLTEAYAAYFLNQHTIATKILSKFKPDTETHATLAHLLHLRQHLEAATLPNHLEKHLSNPVTALLAAWAAARHYATKAEWADVLRYATLGREQAPKHLPLLALQFKALVNTDNAQAETLLPTLKSHLGPTRTKLISQILQGPTTLSARPLLENRWVKQFQEWLITPSEDFPHEPKG